MDNKLLFILKKKQNLDPTAQNVRGLSTGLFNSASFMNELVKEEDIPSIMEIAIDNNCIDRLVTKHKPTHVIIEALWIVPPKFEVLTRLHPNVKWIIRLHSDLPFMAMEGNALSWIGDYLTYPQLYIACNASRMHNDIKMFIGAKNNWDEKTLNDRIIYLPNFYPQEYTSKTFDKNKYWIDIACFGAIRPLKNQLIQAVAALKFAVSIKKQLRFHINADRVEGRGEPVMNNIKSMFEHLSDSGHQLCMYNWAPREEFLQTCASVDIGMQCSFSETFNIVCADHVSQGVPVVCSSEIPWNSPFFTANSTETDSLVAALRRTYRFPKCNVLLHQRNLTKYTEETRIIWSEYFKE